MWLLLCYKTSSLPLMAFLLTFQEQDNFYDDKIVAALKNVALQCAICKFTSLCVAFLGMQCCVH